MSYQPMLRTRDLPNRNDDDMNLETARDAIECAMPMLEYSPDDDETLTIIQLSNDAYFVTVVTPARDQYDTLTVCNYIARFYGPAVIIERVYLSHFKP